MSAAAVPIARRSQEPRRATTISIPAVVLAAGAVVVIGQLGLLSFAHEPLVSAAPETAVPAWVSLLSASWLVLGVGGAWLIRSECPGAALGLALAVVGAALPAWGSWVALSPPVRSGLLVAPALFVAGVGQVVLGWPPLRRHRVMGGAMWALAALAAGIHLAAYDPLQDPWCSRVCRSAPAPLADLVATEVTIAITGALLISAATLALREVASAAGVPPIVRLAAAVTLVVAVALIGVELALRDTEPWARTTSLALPWALALPAGAVCLVAYRSQQIRRALDAVLEDLGAATGTSGRVRFAVPGEARWVDAAGREVVGREPDTVVLWDENGPAVRLAAAHDTVGVRLSPSRRLALANARLSALTSLRLAELRAAQRRTVQRSDEERHRIERDLHDGAQQTLVSAAFHLGVVSARSGDPPEVRHARDEVSAALARLRDLVRGPIPPVLLDEGLVAAVEELLAESDVVVRLLVQGAAAPPVDVATATFLAVRALLLQPESGLDEIRIGLERASVRLVMCGTGGREPNLPVDVLDRVGAVGGSVRSHQAAAGWNIETELPCAW